MPYVKVEEATKIRNNLKGLSFGQLNLLYTQEYVRMWTENPRYDTWHAISRTLYRPELEPGVNKLTQEARMFHSITDLLTARTEAIAEFRRRVIAAYEDVKIAEAETQTRIDPYSGLIAE